MAFSFAAVEGVSGLGICRPIGWVRKAMIGFQWLDQIGNNVVQGIRNSKRGRLRWN